MGETVLSRAVTIPLALCMVAEHWLRCLQSSVVTADGSVDVYPDTGSSDLNCFKPKRNEV